MQAPPVPVVDEAALKKQKAAEEAAAINAAIAKKMAEKPVQVAEPFKRKFDGFKRHENRDRHAVKRTGAGDGASAHVRRSEVEAVKAKLASVGQAAKVVRQKTTKFFIGDDQHDGIMERSMRKMTRSRRTRSTRSTHSSDEPQHGHNLRWTMKPTESGGLIRALTRRISSGTSSKLFANTSSPMEGGLEAYDEANARDEANANAGDANNVSC